MFIYAVGFAILVLDQITKFLALKFLDPQGSIPLVQNIFHLSLIKNPGIAFGLFGRFAPFLTGVVILCLIGLIVLSVQMRHAAFIQRISLVFIIGGAAGNLMDRIFRGYVVDFLDFRVWPVFNLADSFITAGVALFICTSFKRL